MLDINFIRQNPEKVKEACEKKQVKVDVDKLLDLDKEVRKYKTEEQELRAMQNKLGQDKIDEGKKLKEQIKAVKKLLSEGLEAELNSLLQTIPNIPFDDVPVGKSDADNVVLRKVGKIPNFKFNPRSYLEIGERLDIIDVERASKVAGSSFGYLKGQAALMEFALVNLAFDLLIKKGFEIGRASCRERV